MSEQEQNPETFHRWLQIREKEVDLACTQANNQHENNKLNFDHAIKTVEVKSKTHEITVKAISAERRDAKILIGVTVFMLLLFFGYCINSNNSELVQKFIDAAILVIPSLAGGYGYGYLKGSRKQSKMDD